MGLYDTLIFKCRCGHKMYSQTKILGNCSLNNFIVGNIEKEDPLKGNFVSIFEQELFNCLFKVKEKCPKCGAQNIIRIVNGELIEVVKDKNELLLVELDDEYVKEEIRFGGIV